MPKILCANKPWSHCHIVHLNLVLTSVETLSIYSTKARLEPQAKTPLHHAHRWVKARKKFLSLKQLVYITNKMIEIKDTLYKHERFS